MRSDTTQYHIGLIRVPGGGGESALRGTTHALVHAHTGMATAATNPLTPKKCMASLATYSRTLLRITARPSARRLYGVRPAPLSCNSHRWPSGPRTSAMLIARPSPSCPAQLPNWCPP
eukprot:352965-Chlamydomonas_euryale.AAC.11